MSNRRNKARFQLRPQVQIRLIRNIGATLLLVGLVWGTYNYYNVEDQPNQSLVVRVKKFPVASQKQGPDSSLIRINGELKRLRQSKQRSPLKQAQIDRLKQEAQLRRALEDHGLRQQLHKDGSHFPMEAFRKKEQLLKRQLQHLPPTPSSSSPR